LNNNEPIYKTEEKLAKKDGLNNNIDNYKIYSSYEDQNSKIPLLMKIGLMMNKMVTKTII